MLIDIPERARLAERHRRAARPHLSADGLARRVRHNAWLVVPELVVVAAKQLPKAGHNNETKQVHCVVRSEIRPDLLQVLKRRVWPLVFRALTKENRVPVETLLAGYGAHGHLALALPSRVLHFSDGQRHACSRPPRRRVSHDVEAPAF